MDRIQLTEAPIDSQAALASARDPSCGAVACFEGNIRSENQGEAIIGLEYEVYPDLFDAEVKRIIREANDKWNIFKVALVQRTGKLKVGETGIFIAVSSPHRREALDACSFIIEEFKKRAPVWKKESQGDNEVWL